MKSDPDTIVLCNQRFSLELAIIRSRLWLSWFGALPKQGTWALPASGLFQAEIDQILYDATTLELVDIVMDSEVQGAQGCIFRFKSGDFKIDHHVRLYAETALLEMWQEIRNTGNKPQRVSRLDSFSVHLESAAYELLYFDSDWGQEFGLKRVPLNDSIVIEVRSGRSSKGKHPWFGLVRKSGEILSGSLAWSGNWVFRFDMISSGVKISAGLNDWQFEKELQANQSLISPKAVLVLGKDLNDVSQQYISVGRRYWYPRNQLSSKMPVEWNHWWSYEDRNINEDQFKQNIIAADRIGIDVCTLDAGWFGPDDPGDGWYAHRGDWDLVHPASFPAGIRSLSDAVHKRGMAFGLWCEIEGLGDSARLAQSHPDFVATRAGRRLGYVCFGNSQARDWAFDTLDRIITTYKLDWVKLDFNVDPGAGCDRTDHGHGSGDGLFEHYLGYYRLLDRLREAHPEVILENCSSGGLRIDLGIMQHTHLTFLSDPDWPVHSLQVFWGASLMLAPEVCLHWSFSDWRSEDRPAQQSFDPHDPALSPRQLDYYTRIAMLGVCGFSQKLNELPDWIALRLRDHIRVYRDHVRKFVREGKLFHLTGQPERYGTGERWCAFQYSLSDDDQHLLFIFRLPGAEQTRSIGLLGLQPGRSYRVGDFQGSPVIHMGGEQLMSTGIFIQELLEEESLLLWVRAY